MLKEYMKPDMLIIEDSAAIGPNFDWGLHLIKETGHSSLICWNLSDGLSCHLVSLNYVFSFINSFISPGTIAIMINRNGRDAAMDTVCNAFKLPTDNNT